MADDGDSSTIVNGHDCGPDAFSKRRVPPVTHCGPDANSRDGLSGFGSDVFSNAMWSRSPLAAVIVGGSLWPVPASGQGRRRTRGDRGLASRLLKHAAATPAAVVDICHEGVS